LQLQGEDCRRVLVRMAFENARLGRTRMVAHEEKQNSLLRLPVDARAACGPPCVRADRSDFV
jgi:hypothetical protein